MMRRKIYLSGPMTGDGTPEAMAKNVAEGVRMAKVLMRAGFAVMCPHLTGLMPGHLDFTHAEWIANDLPWVAVSDAVFRIRGKSSGADAECDFATECDVPVFTSLSALMAYFPEVGMRGMS
jgi:hypothetical protein